MKQESDTLKFPFDDDDLKKTTLWSLGKKAQRTALEIVISFRPGCDSGCDSNLWGGVSMFV